MRNNFIKFDLNQPRFEKTKNYTFKNENGVDFDMKFIDYSRIDGYPMFEIDLTKAPIGTILANVTYQGIKPKSASIVQALEDHMSMFRGNDFTRNRDILMDFFFDMYDIDLTTLTERDGIKEIMRDIKLINVLD